MHAIDRQRWAVLAGAALLVFGTCASRAASQAADVALSLGIGDQPAQVRVDWFSEAEGQYWSSRDFAVGQDGSIYVAYAWESSGVVKRYVSPGRLTMVTQPFPEQALSPYLYEYARNRTMDMPRRVAVDHAGNIYVVFGGLDAFAKFDPQGRFVWAKPSSDQDFQEAREFQEAVRQFGVAALAWDDQITDMWLTEVGLPVLVYQCHFQDGSQRSVGRVLDPEGKPLRVTPTGYFDRDWNFYSWDTWRTAEGVIKKGVRWYNDAGEVVKEAVFPSMRISEYYELHLKPGQYEGSSFGLTRIDSTGRLTSYGQEYPGLRLPKPVDRSSTYPVVLEHVKRYDLSGNLLEDWTLPSVPFTTESLTPAKVGPDGAIYHWRLSEDASGVELVRYAPDAWARLGGDKLSRVVELLTARHDGKAVTPVRYICSAAGANVHWLPDKGIAVARLNGKRYEFDPARDVVTTIASPPKTVAAAIENRDGMLWVDARQAAKALDLPLHADDNGRVLYLAIPRAEG